MVVIINLYRTCLCIGRIGKKRAQSKIFSGYLKFLSNCKLMLNILWKFLLLLNCATTEKWKKRRKSPGMTKKPTGTCPAGSLRQGCIDVVNKSLCMMGNNITQNKNTKLTGYIINLHSEIESN